MKTRKTNFSNVLGLFIFLLVIILNAQTELSQSKHYNLQKLAEGVYAAIHNDDGGYAICNAGIVDLGDKTIVIDPFISPTAARDLKKHAELLTGKPVSLVLNLDPHSDHTRGNQVFVPEADIIGTANARRFIAREFHKGVEYEKEVSPKQLLKIQKQLETASEDEKIELKMWYGYHKAKVESFPELVMTPPNITIIDTMTIYGSERNIVIIPTGIGHTIGDMVAYLPKENIIFMSDLLFNERHPYIGDGDPASWKKTLQKITLLKPEITIPGHGPVGDTNTIYTLIDYFDTLTDLVNEEIKKGTDKDKIAKLPIPEKFKDWRFSGFYNGSLSFLYNQSVAKSDIK